MKRIHSWQRLFPKTSQVLLSATLILLLVLVAGYGAVDASPAKHQAIEAGAKAGSNGFEVVKETYTDRSISINYPQISKMNDAEKQRQLNQILKADALSVLKDYSASDLEQLTVKLDYVIGRQSSGLLSVQFTGSRFLKGTPYPTALFQSINLEMRAGRKLRLQDSIQVNERFVETMKKGRMHAAENVTFEKLRLDSGKLLKIFGQADFTVSSENPERAFSYFTKDGMGISFSVIHALGDHVEFELPMAALSPFIKPEKANVIK